MTVQAHEIQRLTDLVDASLADAPSQSHELVKMHTELVALALVRRIQQDRDALLTQMREEHRVFIEECKTGVRPRYSFLPTIQETFVKRLWDSWSEESKRLPEDCGIHVDVVEGYCFLAYAQWFCVSADSERVMEPIWRYIIDPLPSGIMIFDKEGKPSVGTSLVIAPNSPWGKNYHGMLEEDVRRQEAAEAK